MFVCNKFFPSPRKCSMAFTDPFSYSVFISIFILNETFLTIRKRLIILRNFFRADFFVCFLAFVSYVLKYKKFFKLGSRKFHFLRI